MRIFASFAALPVLAVLSVAVPACDKGQPAATPPADAQNDDQNSADGVLQLPDDSPLSLIAGNGNRHTPKRDAREGKSSARLEEEVCA